MANDRGPGGHNGPFDCSAVRIDRKQGVAKRTHIRRLRDDMKIEDIG
jgi:hypothetical protein